MIMKTCERISGSGPTADCQAGIRYEIALDLSQTGARVNGTMTLFHEPTIGSVTGSVAERNNLVLQGTATNAEHQGRFTIEEWDSALNDDGSALIGRLRLLSGEEMTTRELFCPR